MTANEHDNLCIEQIKLGNEDALNEMMKRYARMIRSFYFKRGICQSIWDDLMQEAMLKIWSRASTFRSGEVVRSWVFAIVRNCMVDFMRKERRKNREVSLSQLVSYQSGSLRDGNDSIYDVIDSHEESSVDTEVMVDIASRVLSECEYSAFEDMLAGIDVREAAGKRGVSECTIRWRKSRAACTLRNCQRFVSEFADV